MTPPERVRLILDVFKREHGLHGDIDTYYEPDNSCIDSVLLRKKGIPVTLSVIFVAVCRRLGVNAFGINSPGHFLVGVEEDGEQMLVDPFSGRVRGGGRGSDFENRWRCEATRMI
jgi:regulator of sirC expression with transglutaminase-like and TPR domain